jgi:hypothetical protein
LGRAVLKRKVYFAFDFDDLMRTNNVRQTSCSNRIEDSSLGQTMTAEA